ncbi:MAG: HEAT repeat domain-containing protein [Spirochaetaceae bacterium]|nr:HEAT repeat domain-containing protein [Spirochaetaceae bacterium]
MKRCLLITFFILLSFQFVFAAENSSELKTNVVIKAADSSDSKDSETKEERESEKEKEINILKFGLDDEISAMLDDFMKEKTYLYLDEVFDLFERSKNVALREKIIIYFTQAKDLRLSEYALEILEDPFDTKKSTVSLLFKYASELEIKEAGVFARTLLENDNTDYFDSALSAMAVLGTPDDAVFLAEYLEREDLSIGQQQSVMKALGNIKAVETWDALVEIAQNEEKNAFVRMYAAESIGAMEKPESVTVLIDLYEGTDPNFRASVIKGLANYPEDKEAVQVIIESIRDSHYKVRLEAVSAIKEMKLTEAVPYVLYRAKNDPESSVKYECYKVLGELKSKEGEEYLVSILKDKKQGDTNKIKASEVLLKNGNASSVKEVVELARTTLADDKNKPLRYALGKAFANTENSDLAEICLEYLNSKDASTVGTGLDIFAKNKFASVKSEVQKIADDEKPGPNRTKARKILDRE